MITILRPALQTTVQDLGRRGHRHLGVGLGGVMDRLALLAGNALVGNTDDAAALELCLPPAVMRFDADCVVALTGADCSARLDGATLSVGNAMQAKAGMTVELSRPTRGARAYLCVRGGFDVPLLLGSRSTDLLTQMGGFEGRMIRRGDVLHVRSIEPSSQPAGVALPARSTLPPQRAWSIDAEPIRVMPAPEFNEFTPESRAALLGLDWKISPQSNRMGFHLEGPTLTRVAQHELKSHAVFPGVIQVPKGGAPIVLMADAHTTGGYPRIATVIAADQWRMAQIPPGGSLRFSLCARVDALQALKRSLDAH